ncbi:hypothetical protein HHK36_015181 [Tetracentron sinense]|uniref:Uncharacterized protein n=1 Tax=Tetracentron sinense TaxID=13715 RepID=A0A835DDL9_TETSI|nr:hypothetical protein HHK36_015181 [Tetracentron sinense]
MIIIGGAPLPLSSLVLLSSVISFLLFSSDFTKNGILTKQNCHIFSISVPFSEDRGSVFSLASPIPHRVRGSRESFDTGVYSVYHTILHLKKQNYNMVLNRSIQIRYPLLLEEDPALKRFKSHKKSVWRLKRIGDVLTIVVVAGCCYEIYVKATMREEARKQA